MWVDVGRVNVFIPLASLASVRPLDFLHPFQPATTRNQASRSRQSHSTCAYPRVCVRYLAHAYIQCEYVTGNGRYVGQRLHTPGYVALFSALMAAAQTEPAAVSTDPAHTGNGPGSHLHTSMMHTP
eukprot:2284829-Prymnesium_polylepis.2